jgi:hypothetical protein
MANCVSHILRRNCILKHIMEGKIEGTGRRGRRRKQFLDDLKEKILESERGSTRLNCVDNWLCMNVSQGRPE